MWLWLGLGLAGILGFEMYTNRSGSAKAPATVSAGDKVYVSSNALATLGPLGGNILPATAMYAVMIVTSNVGGNISGNVIGYSTDNTGNSALVTAINPQIPATVPLSAVATAFKK